MIARLRGELLEASAGRVVVDCSGVGYEAFVSESTLVHLPPPGAFVDLHVRHVVREDGQSLYGFLTGGERRVFDLLGEVKGCGPKVSLSLLGELGEQGVADSIAVQDAKALTRASGVGPRLAERILVELRDKMVQEFGARKIAAAVRRSGSVQPVDDLLEALLQLGYRRVEAEEAAAEARKVEGDLQVQLREALRRLAK